MAKTSHFFAPLKKTIINLLKTHSISNIVTQVIYLFLGNHKIMKNRLVLLPAVALLVFSSAAAYAGAAPAPSTAEPGRASRQIAPLDAPLQVEGAGTVSGGKALEAPAGAEKVKLKLNSVTIEGMTAYSDAEIRRVYSKLLGTTITLADVYGIANRLTAKYRNDGYILTQIVVPPQTIESGNIRFRAVEGVANEIRVEGETGGSMDFIHAYAEKIRAQKPFSSKKLERYLLLMNDLPGISARAILSPARVPGATDITIVVSRKSVDYFAQVDNRGSRYLGPLQANVGTRLNNMLGLYEGINFQYATAPNNRELRFFSTSYVQPIGSEGTQLTLGGSITRTRPGYTLTPFSVDGISREARLELSHPFIRSRGKNLSATIKLDRLSSKRADNTGAAPVKDRLNVLRIGSIFQIVDRFAGANTAAAEISRGLNMFNSTGGWGANTTRPGAPSDFTKATLELSRLQRLNNDFDLYVSAIGQLSGQRLLTSEQFGVGGTFYGSAYDSSEITGDDGFATRAELRYNQPFNNFSLPLRNSQLYGFWDFGKVWDPGNATAAQRINSLASAGAGYRFSLNENISGSFELAAPLTRPVSTGNDTSPRAFGSLTARF